MVTIKTRPRLGGARGGPCPRPGSGSVPAAAAPLLPRPQERFILPKMGFIPQPRVSLGPREFNSEIKPPNFLGTAFNSLLSANKGGKKNQTNNQNPPKQQTDHPRRKCTRVESRLPTRDRAAAAPRHPWRGIGRAPAPVEETPGRPPDLPAASLGPAALFPVPGPVVAPPGPAFVSLPPPFRPPGPERGGRSMPPRAQLRLPREMGSYGRGSPGAGGRRAQPLKSMQENLSPSPSPNPLGAARRTCSSFLAAPGWGGWRGPEGCDPPPREEGLGPLLHLGSDRLFFFSPHCTSQKNER